MARGDVLSQRQSWGATEGVPESIQSEFCPYLELPVMWRTPEVAPKKDDLVQSPVHQAQGERKARRFWPSIIS